MSPPDKPDLARGWKNVEKLVDQEADRVAHLSDAEFDREMASEPAPAHVPSVEALLRKAEARAAADPEGVRAAHGRLAAVAAKDAARAPHEGAKAAAARAARRWVSLATGLAAAAVVLLAWRARQGDIVGRPPGEDAVAGASWVVYASYFFGGLFLTNAIPHWVSGLMGRPFPTPFAKPPGEGLSSPTVNVVWGLLHLGVAYVFFRQVQPFDPRDIGSVVAAAIGALIISLRLARHMGRFHGGARRT
jgi:hypothetical protein